MAELIEVNTGNPEFDDERALEEILDEINDIVNLASSTIGYLNHRLIQEDLNIILQRYGEKDGKAKDNYSPREKVKIHTRGRMPGEAKRDRGMVLIKLN